MRRAIGRANKDQQAAQDAARALGCVMCLLRIDRHQQRNIACGPVRIHHRTTGDLHGNKQLGQDAFVALGDWHHQGVNLPGWSMEGMTVAFGPSLYHHKRAFVEYLQDTLGERSTAALQQYQDSLIDGSPSGASR